MKHILFTLLALTVQTTWAGKPKPTTPHKEKTMYAEFDTSEGKFTVKLLKDKAPKTVENFVGLANGTKEWTDPKTGKKVKKPFFDGLTFHRIIKGFMIQGGDPKGNGTGGPGYEFADEFHPDLTFQKPGVLAMANAGPNTNGSQFFVTVAPYESGNNHYSIFGEVSEGMSTVTKLSEVKVHGDQPVTPPKIKSVKIVEK